MLIGAGCLSLLLLAVGLGVYLGNVSLYLGEEGLTRRGLWPPRTIPWNTIESVRVRRGVVQLSGANGIKLRFLKGVAHWKSLRSELHRRTPQGMRIEG